MESNETVLTYFLKTISGASVVLSLLSNWTPAPVSQTSSGTHGLRFNCFVYLVGRVTKQWSKIINCRSHKGTISL